LSRHLCGRWRASKWQEIARKRSKVKPFCLCTRSLQDSEEKGETEKI
jgi:hypothetical protein